MQELEKILEEIDVEIEKERTMCEDIEDTPGWRLYEKTMKRAKDIIRKHMSGKDINVPANDGWISAEERLPEDREWYLTLFKEPETGFIGLPYIADYLGRKTKTTTNEGWIIRNCTDNDMENCDYYKNLEGVAWRPLPDPYRPERSDNHDGE